MPNRIPSYRSPLAPSPTQVSRSYNRGARDATLKAIYWSQRWKDFRAAIRRDRILCEPCKADDRWVPGVLVHHLVDPRDRPDLTYDESNVMLVCRACHNNIHAKTPRRST